MASASRPDYGMFCSARLIYRAPEASDDGELFRKLIFDRTGYALSNYTNNRLAGTEDAIDYRKYCAEKCHIGAIICLPPPTAPSGSHSPGAKAFPIGEIHIKNMGPDRAHHRNGEIGLQILNEYQGKGYGTEAIEWVLNWAFRHTGLHRVSLKAFEYNIGAIKLYAKCGFREEGREREAVWHDGRWRDIVCMSLLEDEWRDLQEARKSYE